MTEMKKSTAPLAFIGSYADPNTSGIYACSYDPDNGTLSILDQVSGLRNPTFLDVDSEANKLYALAEEIDDNEQRYSSAAAFDINTSTGELTILNKEVTVPASTCHLSLDQSKRFIAVSSYHGGWIGLAPILSGGRVGPLADSHKHEGSSLLPVQDRARAHSVFFDAANQFAVACDLGLDLLIVYRLDEGQQRLLPHDQVPVTPGSGPRHFAFHPTQPFGYLINELNATVNAYAYDAKQGKLTELQSISTLPKDYHGDNACADIHISPDGKFLYGSNRGHDSIVVYAIDQVTGELTVVEHASTKGKHPRNFAISPDGRFLLAANRDTDNVVSFRRDEATGKLEPSGFELQVSKPVCVKFM
jgi:6-phosphogluconolactonase